METYYKTITNKSTFHSSFLWDKIYIELDETEIDLSKVTSKLLYNKFKTKKQTPPSAQSKMKNKYPQLVVVLVVPYSSLKGVFGIGRIKRLDCQLLLEKRDHGPPLNSHGEESRLEISEQWKLSLENPLSDESAGTGLPEGPTNRLCVHTHLTHIADVWTSANKSPIYKALRIPWFQIYFLTLQVFCLVCYQFLEIGAVYQTVGSSALVMRETMCDQNFPCMILMMNPRTLLLTKAGKKRMLVKNCCIITNL